MELSKIDVNTTTQPKRLTPRDMNGEIKYSAWWYRFGGDDYRRAYALFSTLEEPMSLFSAWFVIVTFYAIAHFASPFNLAYKPGTQVFADDVSIAKVMVVMAIHGLFLYFCLLYAAKVLFMVPWKDTHYPLVMSVDFSYGFNWIGLHYVMFAAIALVDSRAQSFNIWLIGLEGLVFLYLHYGQPALGFVPWKRGDGIRLSKSLDDQARNKPHAVQAAQVSLSAPAQDGTYEVPVSARYANLKFDSIFGMSAIKEKLLAPARAILANNRVAGESPRNGFLLHGEPGNGKTIFAEALAGELGVPFIDLTYGHVSSQWLGNMPKVLTLTFAYAKRSAPCVLFVDEIDSFIKSRDLPSNNAEDHKITNTILTEIVNLRGHKVILIGATNYLAHLDAAAIREGRFDFKVEITPPDEEARIGLIHSGVRKYAVGLEVDQDQAVSVAKRWNGFSVARLMAICKALPEVAQNAGDRHIRLNEWMVALREVQGRRGKLPADTKALSELVLEAATRDALNLIANRLKDVARIEALGGTLPSGVLFHGPSGTGKTAAARALAKEVGWAFLNVAGPDLLADRSKLDKLYAEAKDIRPTLIFIDEADDVLRNRQFSSTPDLVNKLLTLMDGFEDRVQDVVWVAATNNPDQIEPALLRSGRFTEKVLFTPPPQDQVPRHISMWMARKNVAFESALDAFDVAEALRGQTIADIEGVLQYALNSAIGSAKQEQKPVIHKTDLQQAMRIVLELTL